MVVSNLQCLERWRHGLNNPVDSNEWILLLFASSAIAQTVKMNWQANAPVADYRTYAWRPATYSE